MTPEDIERLKRVEAWARWWLELPEPCWSGYHMRGYRGLRDSLSDIAPLKPMAEEEISPRSEALRATRKAQPNE